MNALFHRPIRGVLNCALISSSLLLATATSAMAQDYPTRPVRLVVGFPAGGPTDVPARFIADKLSAALGKPVVVENKPGAGSMLADQVVRPARAGPRSVAALLSGRKRQRQSRVT